MSWFDGSFSFARSALSQAQKSIDKVLDIQEEQGATQKPTQPDPPSTSSAVKDSSNDKPKSSPKFSTSTPKQSSSRPPPSTRTPSSPKTTPVTASPSQDSFTSTWGGAWGGGSSPWASLTTPSKKPEGVASTSRGQRPAAGSQDGGASSAKKSQSSGNRQRKGSGSHPTSSSSHSRPPVRHAKSSEDGGVSTGSDQESLSPSSQPCSTATASVTQGLHESNETGEKSKTLESHTVTVEESVSEKSTVEASSGNLPESEMAAVDPKYREEEDGGTTLPSVCDQIAGRPLPVQHHAVINIQSSNDDVGDLKDSERGRMGEGESETEDLVVLARDARDGETKASPVSGKEMSDRKESTGASSPPPNSSGLVAIQHRADDGGDLTEVPLTENEVEEQIDSNSPFAHRLSPSPPPPVPTASPTLESSPSPPLHISHSPAPPTSPLTSVPQFTPSSVPPTTSYTQPVATTSTTISQPLQEIDLGSSQPLTEQQPSPPEEPETVVEVERDRESTTKEVEVISKTSKPSTSQEGSSGGAAVKREGMNEPDRVDDREMLTESKAVEALQEELVKVKQLLEARETKMLEMSREAILLTEANQDLQSRLSAAERDLHTSQGGVDELRSEFTKRIATTEKKLQTVLRERDSLKKQLQVLTAEQTNQRKSASQELSTLLKEKEEQITGLMEEGEKLSKKELQNSNIIKKLKEKNKQNDQLLTAQRQQIEDLEKEVTRLKDVVKKKEENERKYQESMAQLNSIAEQQDKELTALKAERDELTDKARSLQTNLDNAYKELSDLHKATAVNKTAAHEAVVSAEQTARQELTEAVEKQRVEHHREKEKLLLEIGELRASVSRCEQQAAWREERMKQEVSDVQQRLQEAEMRNQELTTTISQTTKPFLRQIETLRSAHSAQTANWEKVEADLTHRLVEAQTQLSAAVEKERGATEKALTLQSRIAHLEKQTASLRQEKARLLASLELEKAKAETLEEAQQRESAKVDAMRTSMQQSLEELRKEKEMLERQLEYERVRLEAESRKACLESQEKERLRSQLASSLSRGLSRQSSTASTTYTQSEILEKSLVRQMSEDAVGTAVSDSSTSLYHSRTPPTSASAIEQLQSLLKQKEGELANAQTLVSSLERSRAAMANDLAAVSTQNVELSEKVDTIPQLQTKLQELQKRNEALLQMYGEKAEEAEELRLDIQDLKEMYRQQIDALTKR